MTGIEQYKHPYLTVDGVILRATEKGLEVLLDKRKDEFGEWSLPGGFVPVDELAETVLRRKVKEKTGVTISFAEQLRTYDALDRDPRSRVISMAYLCLTNREEPGNWFLIRDGALIRGSLMFPIEALAFDHGQILKDALERLAGKLWWSDLAMYLLPETFPIREIERLYEMIEGRKTGMIKRQLGKRIEEVGEDNQTGGRPAKMYRWVPENKRSE